MKHFNTPLRKIAGSLLAGAFLAGSVHAAPVQVTELGTATGLTVNLQLPVNTAAPNNYFTGSQTIAVGTNANSFLAFCIDPFQWSPTAFTSYQSGSLSVSDAATHYDASQAARISNLFSYAYAGTVGTTDANKLNAAAMQLALWEIVNDDGNLGTGLVKTTASTTGSVIDATNALLNYQGTGGPQYNLTVYRSSSNQDYLVATPVPEPGTYAMFLAGLGLMMVIARRRSAS